MLHNLLQYKQLGHLSIELHKISVNYAGQGGNLDLWACPELVEWGRERFFSVFRIPKYTYPLFGRTYSATPLEKPDNPPPYRFRLTRQRPAKLRSASAEEQQPIIGPKIIYFAQARKIFQETQVFYLITLIYPF